MEFALSRWSPPVCGQSIQLPPLYFSQLHTSNISSHDNVTTAQPKTQSMSHRGLWRATWRSCAHDIKGTDLAGRACCIVWLSTITIIGDITFSPLFYMSNEENGNADSCPTHTMLTHHVALCACFVYKTPVPRRVICPAMCLVLKVRVNYNV